MKKIMVVDNDIMMLEFMSDLLEKEGHNVLTANDGLSALEKVESYSPDIMFIDLVMPNIDGEKLCRIIRKNPEFKDIHIVIVSATASEHKIDFAGFGADACIAKASFNKMSERVLYVLESLCSNMPDGITKNIIGCNDSHSRDITKELLSFKRHSDAILDNISEGILEINLDKKIIYANRFARSLIGKKEEELLGLYFPDIFDAAHHIQLTEIIDLIDYGLREAADDFKLTSSGKIVSLNIFPLYDGEDKSVIIILNDITERRDAEKALRESENKFRNFAEQSIVGINLIQDGVFKYVNPRFAEMFGYTVEECLNNMPFLKLVYPEDLPVVEENVRKRLSGEVDSVKYEFRGLKKTGEIVDIEVFGSSVFFNGKPASVATLLDITERKRLVNEIRELSLMDHLTELYNRRGFIHLAEQLIKASNRAGNKLLLTFIDLDDLKVINDTLGHDEGDRALVESAKIIRNAFRKSDIIARLGGDEFAVLAIDTTGMSSEAISKRIEQKIDEYNTNKSGSYTISMSWGTAVFDPKSPVSAEELMSSADKLMYIQKRAKQTAGL